MKEFILQLKYQVSDLDQRIKHLKIERDKIQSTLEVLEKNLSTEEIFELDNNFKLEKEQDMLNCSVNEAIVKYLSETDKCYTAIQITRAILARGVKSNYEAALTNVRSSLTRLKKENKVTKRGLGYWSI